MTKQEEIREVLDTLCAVAKVKDLTKSPTGYDDEVENAILELIELDVVIKGDSLRGGYSHLSNYYTVAPLIGEAKTDKDRLIEERAIEE